MQSLEIQDDALGNRTEVISLSDCCYLLALAGGVGKTVSVPAQARAVLFSATGNFWLSLNGLPALPTADILDGSAPSLNPGARAVRPGQVLGLVAPSACLVNLAFYG
jgi:hypothetical protein